MSEKRKGLPLTGYQAFCDRWRQGCGSGMCEMAHRKVFARGKMPCDVLFIGEAPGTAEDSLGQPFKGVAGHLLNDIIKKACLPKDLRLAFTNLVCCMPRDDAGRKAAEPLPDEVRACAPRLREFVELADPGLIVCVGAESRNWHDPKVRHHLTYHRPLTWSHDVPGGHIALVEITHPSAMLRTTEAQKRLMAQRASVVIHNAAADLLDRRAAERAAGT